jgi:hypothetical protein
MYEKEEKSQLIVSDQIKIDLARQYSENENGRQGITMTFVSALVTVFTAFGLTMHGYVLTHTKETLFLFILGTTASIIILTIISVISIFYSYSLRRDQIIVDMIRFKSFMSKEKEYEIYFENYQPKAQIQDFYKILIWSAMIIEFFLVLTFYLTISCFPATGICDCECNCLNFLPTVLFVFCSGILYILSLNYKQKLDNMLNKHKEKKK